MEAVISRNPKVLGGTPVFAGTRVPVESLFDVFVTKDAGVQYEPILINFR